MESNIKNRYGDLENDELIATLGIKDIERGNVKTIVIGADILSKDTIKMIYELGDILLMVPGIKGNANNHLSNNIPLLRIIKRDNDILIRSLYELDNIKEFKHILAGIRNLIICDINKSNTFKNRGIKYANEL